MQVFIAAVSLALIVSFLCSIFESVLLSIKYAQVESLAQQGKRSGQLLKEFKHRIDMPIAAILITNKRCGFSQSYLPRPSYYSQKLFRRPSESPMRFG